MESQGNPALRNAPHFMRERGTATASGKSLALAFYLLEVGVFVGLTGQNRRKGGW